MSSMLSAPVTIPATIEATFAAASTPAPPGTVTKAVNNPAQRGRPKFYPVFDYPAALAWLGQVAALELHVPQWRIEQAAVDRYPDRVVFQDRKAERTNAARQVCTWCGHRATIAPRPTTRQGPTRAHYSGLHVRHVCRWCQHLSPIPAAGVLQPGRLHLGRQSSLQ